MTASIVSAKGWVVIPKEFRDKYNLRPGTRIGFVDYGGAITLVPLPHDPVAALDGMLAGESSLTDDLLEEHRREIEADEHALEQLVRT